jgi:hypothetical protein
MNDDGDDDALSFVASMTKDREWSMSSSSSVVFVLQKADQKKKNPEP